MRGRSAANEHVKARPSAARAPRVVGRAHAKVNLDLRVLGTRADGYHELRTVFQTIELHDTLTAQREARPVRAEVPHAGRAARRHGISCGAPPRRCGKRSAAPASRPTRSSRIEKAIPMQAGLGGGSADAAAALLVLARLWGGAPLTLLREVAAAIGSDVAVLPVRRHRARPRPRRGDLSARRSAAALGRHRPAAVRRVDRRGLRLVRRGSRRRAARAAASCRSCRCPGRPGGADDQRPRAAGPAPAPGDHRAQGRAARGGRGRRGDVGQRLGGFRAVPHPARGRPRPSGRCREAGARGPPDPHADPRRARAARPSDPCAAFDPRRKPGYT